MIGFHNLRERFLNAIQNNTLSHAHLMVGPDGIGKSKMVESLSRELLGFGDRNSVDIIRVRPEKTIITVKQIREVVIEASLRPYEGLKKVIIFYEANKMGQEAQNALLKTLEEPLDGVYFFLLTENEMSMTDTILSRCHLHKLYPLGNEEMREYLEFFIQSHNEEEEKRYHREISQKETLKTKSKVEKVKILEFTRDELEGVISVSRGIPERAETILKNQLMDENLQVIYTLFLTLAKLKRDRTRIYYPVLELGQEIAVKEQGSLFDDIIFVINSILKKKSLGIDGILLEDLREKTDILSTELTYTMLEKYLVIFYEMRKYITLGVNINKETIINSLLLKLLEV